MVQMSHVSKQSQDVNVVVVPHESRFRLISSLITLFNYKSNGHELRQQMKWRTTSDRYAALPQRGGLKDYCPDGSWLQQQKLDSFHEERSEILHEERVQKLGCLAVGHWVEDVQKVLVSRDTGQLWKYFGHTGSSGKRWLYPEEALYLMDEGTMDVYFGDVPMSLQKAYAVLLGTAIPVHHYHVFSHLCRYGYIVRRHSEKSVTVDDISSGQITTVDVSNNRKRQREPSVEADPAPVGCARANNCKILKTDDNMHKNSSLQSPTFRTCRGWFCTEWFKGSDTVVSLSDNFNSYEEDGVVSRATFPNSESAFVDGLSSVCLVSKQWADFKSSQKNITAVDEAAVPSVLDILWSGDVKPLISRNQATSAPIADVFRTLKVVKNVDCFSFDDLPDNQTASGIIYDVFQPNSKFRKSCPGQPAVCLCISRQDEPPPNFTCILRGLRGSAIGATLMWAIVDSGDISFYSFNPVDLPADTEVIDP